MLKNYFKIALRNLIKNKSHTFINVGGLSLGIVSALVIFLIIQYDLSFDKWHADSDLIYRIVREDSEFGNISYDTGGPYPLAEAVEKDITGIEFVSLVDNNSASTPVVSYFENGVIQNKLKEENFAYVEPDFFNILTYQWVLGDKESALNRPNTAVITESFAEKMFGGFDVLGREMTINFGTAIELEITGLVKDQPKNSDFPLVLFIESTSKDVNGDSRGGGWSGTSSSLQTYVKLLPGISPESVNAQFDPLIAKYRNEDRAEVMEFFLQPLSQIHFESEFGNYSGRIVEKKVLFALGIIGFLLIITACINFINLNTAIAVSRSKEVGLRKTLGSSKIQLTLLFLGETAFITLLSILVGLGITELILGKVEPIIGFTPELNPLADIQVLTFIASIFVGITLAAGWYPARHLSGFNPIDAIRNKINSSYGQGLLLRRSLIVLQFTITQILIIGTIVISTQVKYFQNQELGFEKEAVIQIDLPGNSKTELSTLKNLLDNESSILSTSFSNTGTLHGNIWGGNYVLFDDTVRHEDDGDIKFIDEDYVETYGLTLLAGTNLVQSDTVNMFLVNETLAKQVGYGDNYDGLIGKVMTFWGNEAPIVGVVNDFNTSSLHESLRPVVLGSRSSYHTGGIKINTERTSEAIAGLENAFNKAYPSAIFEYVFLDDHIAEMYEEEQRFGTIMNSFSVIAILIGCLGLFGLVSYMATTRTKEIGVRKVLGANIMDILSIFGKELSLLLGISFIIAAPISYLLMQQWLADFAYKIELGAGIFLLALGGTILIAGLTVGFKTVSAALANPVDSLKSE